MTGIEKALPKQAIAVLIKIRFAFTGFDLASKRHNKSNKSNQLSISIHLEGAYNQMILFTGKWSYNWMRGWGCV